MSTARSRRLIAGLSLGTSSMLTLAVLYIPVVVLVIFRLILRVLVLFGNRSLWIGTRKSPETVS